MILMPSNDSAVTATVPKILNFVWVGPTMPEWAQQAHRRWEGNLPDGWEMRLWTDEDVRTHSALAKVAEASDQLPPRGIADLLRLWIVSLHGGVYFDLDTLPVDTDRATFEKLAGPAWLGERPDWTPASKVLTNAHFGFPAGHPFLAEVWKHALAQIDRGVSNEHFVAGPRAFRSVWESTGRALPVRTMFPTTTTAGRELRMLAGRTEYDNRKLREAYPDAPMVHTIKTGGIL